MTLDELRASWTASFVLANAAALTDAERIRLALSYYNRAHHDGMMHGVDALKDKTLAGADADTEAGAMTISPTCLLSVRALPSSPG